MSDCYNGVDKEEDKRQRAMEKANDWWDSLDFDNKVNIFYENTYNMLTEEEKDDIIGDREYHERAERGEVQWRYWR